MARLKEIAEKVRDQFVMSIDSLIPGENSRTDFQTVPDLAISILNFGQLSPLEVRLSPDGKQAVICDGERRFRAVQYANEHFHAKIAEMQCVAEPVGIDTNTRLLRQLEHNDRCEPLNGLDRAKAYKVLIDSGMTQHEIAQRTGRSAVYVSTTLAILAAPESIQQSVKEGKTSASAASKVSRASPERRKLAVEKVSRGEAVKVSDVADGMPKSLETLKKMIKKADGYIYAAAKGSKDESRWEGVKYGIECAAGMHEF